jgi:hypothetical protein
MACEGLQMGAPYDCENPLVAGVNQRLILMDLQVWNDATKTFDPTTPNLLTSVTLGSGDQGWAFEGIRTSLAPQSNFIPSTNSVGYDHQTDFIVFDISAEQKANLETMGLNKMVGVVENANAVGNSNSVFEVFGAGVGMELITNARLNNDQDTNGGYSISLKTSDNSGKEPHLPYSWWDTDYATTKAEVDALLTP